MASFGTRGSWRDLRRAILLVRVDDFFFTFVNQFPRHRWLTWGVAPVG